MIKILFVCHGNICRSPMAEFVFKDKLRKAGALERFQVASVAVSREELGNPVYPPARRELAKHGIACDEDTLRRSLVCAGGSQQYILGILGGYNAVVMGYVSHADKLIDADLINSFSVI